MSGPSSRVPVARTGGGISLRASAAGKGEVPLDQTAPFVAYTLVLFNNTLVPGNFLAGNGVYPTGIAYDRPRGEIFVADGGSNNVSVISDTTNAVVATIRVGANPFGVVYDGGKGEVFVTNQVSNNVSVISDATNSVVASIPVGAYPTGVAYDSAKGEMFVTNYISNNVSVISDATNAVVASIPVGTNPFGVAYTTARGARCSWPTR